MSVENGAKSPIVFINATACKLSGAASILRQLLEAITTEPVELEYYVFCDEQYASYARPFLHIMERSDNQKWLSRMYWDLFGLSIWARARKILPNIVVSMQNTGIRGFRKTPQIVYLHQSLPFVKEKNWSLNASEWKYWFYANVYGKLIRWSIPSGTTIVVQTEWMRQAIIKQFKRFEAEVIKCRPSMQILSARNAAPGPETVFFYPAANLPYKNHDCLYKAAEELLRVNKDAVFKIVLTIEPTGPAVEDLRTKSILPHFEFIESIPFSEVLRYYETCTALLFPSYIETFGLPLAEAAQMGVPVLAANLPYAYEVLHGYQGAVWLPYDDPKAWATAMEHLLGAQKRYPPPEVQKKDGWSEFAGLMKKYAYQRSGQR